ncbi:hypothetical protein ACW3SO_21280, partial [Xanthomonas campestris]
SAAPAPCRCWSAPWATSSQVSRGSCLEDDRGLDSIGIDYPLPTVLMSRVTLPIRIERIPASHQPGPPSGIEY